MTTMIHNNRSNEMRNNEEIKAAIAKGIELRAIHAALIQRTSPTHLSFLSSSTLTHRPQAHDYPVFTPSYEDETLSGTIQSDYYPREAGSSTSAKGRLNSYCNNYYDENQETRSITSSYTNHISNLQASPAATEVLNSRRRRNNSLGEFKSVSSKFGFSDVDSNANYKHSNIIVPLTDSHVAVNPQRKAKKMIFSRFFSKLKKKPKESEWDFGAVSVETLKKELVKAIQERDVALSEAVEMKSSLGDLRKKLENLEGYCEELKRALRPHDKPGSISSSGKLVDVNALPVCEEVMSEGFLQIVSEARLSVKQFCKTLVEQIEESDDQLIDNLNSRLHPYKVSLLTSKYSKAVLYHLEAITNETLHQDFENCVFKKNGSPKILDPYQDRQTRFSSFVALRNLSWNEVLRKGTKYYSEEFSKFCDQKMSNIISDLSWIKPWPEQLLQSFFVAAKCVWLLHLLAFSCYPPLTILRVEENRSFDPNYMDDILIDKQRVQKGSSRVKVMVMPGFYVQDKILRCKVLCRYKSLK